MSRSSSHPIISHSRSAGPIHSSSSSGKPNWSNINTEWSCGKSSKPRRSCSSGNHLRTHPSDLLAGNDSEENGGISPPSRGHLQKSCSFEDEIIFKKHCVGASNSCEQNSPSGNTGRTCGYRLRHKSDQQRNTGYQNLNTTPKAGATIKRSRSGSTNSIRLEELQKAMLSSCNHASLSTRSLSSDSETPPGKFALHTESWKNSWNSRSTSACTSESQSPLACSTSRSSSTAVQNTFREAFEDPECWKARLSSAAARMEAEIAMVLALRQSVPEPAPTGKKLRGARCCIFSKNQNDFDSSFDRWILIVVVLMYVCVVASWLTTSATCK